MLKPVLKYSGILLLATSCTSLKQAMGPKKQAEPSSAVSAEKKEVKFLDDINVGVEQGTVVNEPQKPIEFKDAKPVVHVDKLGDKSDVERATVLQIRYALRLDTEIEQVKDLDVYSFVDEWYGTRYRLGGSTKSGIDCSAFTQLFFSTLYGVSIPRTAREQHSKATKVNRTHLKMGDLLFFNTRGGVSHVGVYLQNNKFVHASTSEGVMISDMYDTYWLKKFIGAGRIDTETVVQGTD